MSFRSVLFFLVSVFYLPSVFAGQIESLQGDAEISLSRKNRVHRFYEAVVINREGSAEFETLDDFGNTLVRIHFNDRKTSEADISWMTLETREGVYQSMDAGFKKILSLPLSRDEFVSFLLYQIPHGIEDLLLSYAPSGNLVSVEKKSGRKKGRYKISFLDIKKKGKVLYPWVIEIVSNQTTLRISWKNVLLGRTKEGSP